MLTTVEHKSLDRRCSMWLSSWPQSVTSTLQQWRSVSSRCFCRTLCRERAFGCAFPLVSYSRRCHCSVTMSDSICTNQQLLPHCKEIW